MMSKSTCLLAITMAMLCGASVQAAVLDNPINNAIEKAVSDAMQKLFQGVGGIHAQVASNVDSVHQVVGAVNQVTDPILTGAGTAAQQILNDYRTMGQTVVSSYKTLGNQMLGSLAGVGSTLGVAYDQLDSVLSAYEAQYCTPAKFIPSVKKPAKFTGPGFELELSAGQCMFDDDELMANNKKQLICEEPSITLIKTPANFTSKYKTAPKFVSKECKVRKEFGEPIQKVLYVFDGSGPVDLNAITTTVMNEIRSVTGSIGGAHQALAGQLTSFIGGIPNMGMGLKMPTFTY